VDSIGLQIQGRQSSIFKNLTIVTDIPISIEDNPNSTVDADHFHFQDCYLIATDMSQPIVRIATGINLTNVTFDGYQAWVKGSYGLFWEDTTTSQSSENLRLENIRWEQSTNATGYAVYISHNYVLNNLTVKNLYAGSGTDHRGLYFRKCKHIHLDSTFYAGTGEALNADNSNEHITFTNCFWQAGSSVTFTGWTAIWKGPLQYATTPLPQDGVYYVSANPIRFNSETSFVPGSVVSDVTADTTFAPSDGNIFIRNNTDSSSHNLNPTGTFTAGHWIILVETGRAQAIVFDSAGLNATVAAGKMGIFVYNGSAWKGSQVN